MFTGIITDIGEIVAISRAGGETLLDIRCHYTMDDIAIGASIACQGVCLTVIEKMADSFRVSVSDESLKVTAIGQWQKGTAINLERALKLGDELGGHLVLGHIDGLAQLLSVEPVGQSHRLTLQAPADLSRFIASKGSVALDGVSLTVNEVKSDQFSVNIIPHSWSVTTLGQRKAGDALHLEVDMMARYLERLLPEKGIAA